MREIGVSDDQSLALEPGGETRHRGLASRRGEHGDPLELRASQRRLAATRVIGDGARGLEHSHDAHAATVGSG